MATQVSLNSGAVSSAGSLKLQTNGTTDAVTIDTSQNVGIGTSSPGSKLDILNTTNAQAQFSYSSTIFGRIGRLSSGNYEFSAYENGASLIFGTSGVNGSTTERMRLDASGNLLVGTTTAAQKLTVFSASGSQIGCQKTSGAASITFGSDTTIYSTLESISGGGLVFYTGNGTQTERARIDSSGNLLVASTSQFGAGRLCVINDSTHNAIVAKDSGSSNYLFDGLNSSGTTVFAVLASGNVQNLNNSYGALSDIKLKENITDATPKLAQLNQVRVVNYNLIGEEAKQLGVVAQELEQIFPSMVESTPDRDEEGNDLGTTTKSVKYSVFVPILIKAIQEQQALIASQSEIITQLQAQLTSVSTDVAALKAK